MSAEKRRERERLRRLYHHLYQHYEYERMPGGSGCFYCGAPSDTIDHMPSLSWIESRRIQDWKRARIGLYKVPCCMDCNRILGSRGFFTPIDRAKLIEEKLQSQYEKRSAMWSKEEIAEMGPFFRESLKAREKLIKLLLARVRGVQWRVMTELLKSEEANV